MKKTVTMFKGSIFRNIFSILTVLILIMTVFNLTMTLFIRNRLFKDKMQEQNVYIDSYASFMDDTFQSLQNIFTYLQRNDAISWRASSGYRESDNYLKNEQAIFDLLSTFSFTSTPSAKFWSIGKIRPISIRLKGWYKRTSIFITGSKAIMLNGWICWKATIIRSRYA